MGLLTHSTKKKPVSQRSKGLELPKKPSTVPRRDALLGDRYGRGTPWQELHPPAMLPGPMGVKRSKLQWDKEVDVIDWGFRLPISSLPISHPSSAHCAF